MSYVDVALHLDAEGRTVEAAWAYEVAVQQPGTELETFLNLVALYLVSNDVGFAAAHRLDATFVDNAYGRAQEVLRLSEARFGPVPDIQFWRLYLREQVLHEDVPEQAYQELADRGSEMAAFRRFIAARGHGDPPNSVAGLLRRMRQSSTTFSRYVRSFLR